MSRTAPYGPHMWALVILVEGASLRPQLMHIASIFFQFSPFQSLLAYRQRAKRSTNIFYSKFKVKYSFQILKFVEALNSKEGGNFSDRVPRTSFKKHKMIPDTESACQTPAATYHWPEVDDKLKNESSTPENEAASLTAWSRYQHFLAIIKSRGGKFNRKSMIDAMFRGTDLVYSSQC